MVADKSSEKVTISRKGDGTYHTLASAFTLNDVLGEAFDIGTELVGILEEKKGKAEKVLVSSGDFLTGGHKYLVYRIDQEVVGGKSLDRAVEIGKITIHEPYSNHFAKAAVNKGDKEIYKAIADGKKLTCTYKPGLVGKMLQLSEKMGNQ